jgi:hypothetical protein
MRTVFDSIAWVHFGYKTTSYSLPTNLTDYSGHSNFGSLFIGVGGQAQIDRELGVELGIDLGVLRSASEDDLGFGDASASTDLSFKLGGTYHLKDQFYARLLLYFTSQSMDFAGGQSISEKAFSISPSLMYYF